MISFKINNQAISCTKLDTDEFEFTMKYDYLDYYGKSFLKELSFIEDMQEYFNKSSITIEHFNKYALLTLSIPFSKKVVLVQLNRPEIDSDTEIRIELKKQEDRIEKLETQLLEYKFKEEQASRPKSACLDLIFERGFGFYFDYDGYLAKNGSSEEALSQFKEIMNDHFGFKTELEKDKKGNKLYPSGVKSINIYTHTSGGIGTGNKYLCELFNDVDEMLEQIYKPYIDAFSGNTHYICFYNINDLLNSFNMYYMSNNVTNSPNICKIIKNYTSQCTHGTNKHPYDELCNVLKLKSFKVGSYVINKSVKKYKKIQRKFNNNQDVEVWLKKMMLEIADGCIDMFANMVIKDIGPYCYLFY